MKRRFMNAVLDSPADNESKQSSNPFPFAESQADRKKIENKKEEIKDTDEPSPPKSKIVQPTGRSKSDATQKKMTTELYLQSILSRPNKTWKPRSTRKVVIQPKRKVAPVQPFRKVSSTKTSANKQDNNSEEATTDATDEDQIEMDRQYAEELHETYINEDSGILSLDPNFTSDDDMSNLNWGDSGLAAEEDFENDDNLPDLPADESMQEPQEDVSDTDLQVNEDEETADAASNPQWDTILSIDEEDLMTVTPVPDETKSLQSIVSRNEENEGNASSFKNEMTVGSESVVPLSVDFMDSLSRAYDENPSLFDSFAETRLFDGKGHPITTTSLLTENMDNQAKDINKENAVYMDVLTVGNQKTKSQQPKPQQQKPQQPKAQQPKPEAIQPSTENTPSTKALFQATKNESLKEQPTKKQLGPVQDYLKPTLLKENKITNATTTKSADGKEENKPNTPQSSTTGRLQVKDVFDRPEATKLIPISKEQYNSLLHLNQEILQVLNKPPVENKTTCKSTPQLNITTSTTTGEVISVKKRGSAKETS